MFFIVMKNIKTWKTLFLLFYFQIPYLKLLVELHTMYIASSNVEVSFVCIMFLMYRIISFNFWLLQTLFGKLGAVEVVRHSSWPVSFGTYDEILKIMKTCED